MRKAMSNVAINMRELIVEAGGYVAPGQNLKAYFWRLSQMTGLTERVIRAAWSGQQASQRTIDRLREAQGKHEVAELASRLEALAHAMHKADEDFHEQASDTFLRMARELRGIDRARNNGLNGV